LDGWVMRVGEFLRPISGAMAQELLAGSYIQADETPVGVQPESVRGKNHQAYLWQYSRPNGSVVFDFRRFASHLHGCVRALVFDKVFGDLVIHRLNLRCLRIS
jgi:hypothetical protein